MKKKTKPWVLVLEALVAFALLSPLGYVGYVAVRRIIINNPTELSSRLARYHNGGSVLFALDGALLQLKTDGIPITLQTERATEGTVLNNSYFRFRKGDYGKNTVRFTIPAALYDGKADIPVTAEYFNANGWHVNAWHISVLADRETGTVTVIGFVQPLTDTHRHEFNTVTAPLDGTEIILTASGI
ncbi:MAG: hypothetical protein FWF60_04780 [Oscillospiraceae bacterium]|nr:hypothetical protein [Oscillospiraceae bacterium]MCL1952124.1 hypothetical protein [Oscillospiraceae bacterium]